MADSVATLADLRPDARNARKHTPRNVGMIQAALQEVGAARSIVVDESNVVLAGNATVEAAGAAGIERVRIVEADGNELVAVRRTGLSAKQKRRLALYDNRTAELAEWDVPELLADMPATDGLFSASELDEMDALAALAGPDGLGPEIADDPRAAMGRTAFVRLVIVGTDLGLVERALAATGQSNRAAALKVLCEAYLNEPWDAAIR